MNIITSKRHFIRFYASLSFAVLFFSGLATALLFIYNDHDSTGQEKLAPEFLIPFSIALYIAAGYTLYRYIKNTPTITITETTIFFNNTAYSLDSITQLVLTGKQSFSYVGIFKMEATAITFSDTETRYIFDDMYTNAWKIKLFLKERIVDKIKSPVLPLENNEVPPITDTDFFDTYKGNLLFSLRGITLFLMVLLAFAAILSKPIDSIILTMSFFIVFWIYLHARLLYYFDISEKFLITRNYILFWRKKVYSIDNIKEVVYETQGRMPNCLRIITKDFRSTLYPAGTLYDKDWKALQKQLEAYGVLVRNECVH